MVMCMWMWPWKFGFIDWGVSVCLYIETIVDIMMWLWLQKNKRLVLFINIKNYACTFPKKLITEKSLIFADFAWTKD